MIIMWRLIQHMGGQLRLLNIACAAKARVRTVVVTRATRQEILHFSVLGGLERGCGIFISKVEPGSKAQEAGLKRGDQVSGLVGLYHCSSSRDYLCLVSSLSCSDSASFLLSAAPFFPLLLLFFLLLGFIYCSTFSFLACLSFALLSPLLLFLFCSFSFALLSLLFLSSRSSTARLYFCCSFLYLLQVFILICSLGTPRRKWSHQFIILF